MNRILLSIFALCATLLLQGCGKTADPAQTATDFFVGIGQGKIQQAYESTAFGFQASLPKRSFEAVCKTLGLAEKTLVCNWKPAVVGNREAKLEGTVTSSDGKKVPVSLHLILERGQWRVFKLHTAKDEEMRNINDRFSPIGKGVSFNDIASYREKPSERVVRQLIEDDLVMFNDAVQRHSFAEFYNNVSYSWQQQLTLKQLQRAFQPFIEKKVNLGALRTLTAIFDAPPDINSEGYLVVRGHYPSQPYTGEGNPTGQFKIYFTARYTYELPKWKLLGLDVQLTK